MILYYIYLAFEKFIMLFPRSFRRRTFITLSKVAYKLSKKHNLRIEQNLRFVFKDSLSQKEIDEISMYCFENLFLNVLLFLEAKYLCNEEIFKDVHVENREIIDTALESKRPIVFITAHFGTWEMAGAWQGVHVKPYVAIYKELKNKYFEKHLVASRSRFNVTLYKKKGAVKHLLKALRKGESCTIVMDQNISDIEGIKVNFFDHEILQTPSPATLARKTNAILIPAFIVNNEDGSHTLKIREAIEVKQSESEENDILVASQKIALELETLIKENPKMWFWCHRRFKSTHPEIYNN